MIPGYRVRDKGEPLSIISLDFGKAGIGVSLRQMSEVPFPVCERRQPSPVNLLECPPSPGTPKYPEADSSLSSLFNYSWSHEQARKGEAPVEKEWV